MLSVTSETATLPVANAPSRPSRPDQAAGDDFSALIDSATADPRNSDGPAVPSDRPTRADAPSTPADSPRAEPSSQAPAMAASREDRPRETPTAESSGKPSKPGKPEAIKQAGSDKATDDAASENSAPSQQPAAPVDAAAIAVAIAVPVIAPGVLGAPLSPDSAVEPLAIAAAAIAISKSPLEAANAGAGVTPAASPPGPDASANPAPAVAPLAGLGVADLAPIKAAAPVITDATATATASASAEQMTTRAAAPDPSPVAAAIPAAAVAPKAAAKTPPAKIASTAPGEHASDDADTTATQPTGAGAKTLVAQAPAVDGNQKAAANPVEAAKPELPKTDAPAAPQVRHAAAIQLQAEATDAGQPATAVLQPAPSAAAAAPVPQFSVIASSSAAVPLNGLALQIAVTAQSGRSRFEIRLDPAELGRIDVRIDVDRHGQMTSHLTVEKPETLAMLRQDAPQLQRALDNAGFKTGDNGLQFSLRDQSSSGQNGGDQAPRNAQRLIISEDDGVAVAMAGRSYGRLSGSGGGVDIRV